MSNSHEKLPKLFWIQIALIIIVGVLFLLAPSPKKHTTENNEVNSEVQSAAANLKPIGETTVAATSSGAKKARSGEEVYNGICGTCHNTGIANAPKMDDKAAWEPRVANGLAGLMETATKGKGAMPPKGGDPAITEDELKATILYMTKKVGFDLSSTMEEKKKSANNSSKSEPTSEVAKSEPKIEDTVTSAPEAPKAPAAPKAPVITKVVAQAVEQSPPPADVEPTPIESPKEPMPVVAKVIAKDAMDTPKEVVATVNEKPANLEEGKKVYKSSCFACHDAGVAGAPKLTDTANWAPRIAAGNEALYTSALSGKGVMPPKGGNMGLSDDAVKAAVDYMTATAQ